MSGPWRRAALFVAFCALVVAARVVGSGTVALRDARAHEAAAEHHAAAIAYGSAIRMYLPGLPIGHRASEGLVGLADRAAAAGEQDEHRFCLEELRSGWLAVRSTWQPGRRWIDLAEERLVPIMAGDGRSSWPDPALSPTEQEAVVRAVLASRDDPALGWVLLMGLGYVTWLAGASLAIWRGLPADEDSAVHWRAVLTFSAVSVSGYALWLLALARA